MPPLFLAALNDADQFTVLLWIYGGLASLGPVIYYYSKCWLLWKGRGTDTSQFITRAEFNEHKANRDKEIKDSVDTIKGQMAAVQSAVAKLSTEFNNEMRILNRALGKVEGHLDHEEA